MSKGIEELEAQRDALQARIDRLEYEEALAATIEATIGEIKNFIAGLVMENGLVLDILNGKALVVEALSDGDFSLSLVNIKSRKVRS